MEVKTLEEYFILELEETKEQLEVSKNEIEKKNKELEELTKKISQHVDNIKHLLSLIKLQKSNGEFILGDYYKMDINKFDYNGTEEEDFTFINNLVKEYSSQDVEVDETIKPTVSQETAQHWRRH